MLIDLPAKSAPSSSSKMNYGGTCFSGDGVFVEGNNWWKLELMRGSPPAWKYGGFAKRINQDQVIIGDSVYTRIGSSRDQCRRY